MMLLIDAGNTRLKWGVYDDGLLLDHGSVVHVGRGGDPLQFIHDLDTRPERVLAANVAGEIMAERISDRCSGVWSLNAEMVHASKLAHGVYCGYDHFSQLGVDRWVAMIAAFKHIRGAVCVVDAGTAVTLDAIDANGAHQGGLILPGIRLMVDALLEETSDIARLGGEPAEDLPLEAFGRDTSTAINLGAVTSIAATVDRCAAELEKRTAPGAKVIITGGDAALIRDRVQRPVEHREHLILEGLRVIVDS